MNEIFSTARIRFAELYDDALSYLRTTYGEVGQYFSNSSPFGQLLRVTLNLGKLILYYIEDSITELNIQTATRENSIRGLARLTGHNATRGVSASGVVKITYTGKRIDMYGNTVLVPNYTRLKCGDNGLTYTLIGNSDIFKIDLTERNYQSFKIYQGEVESQSYTGNGEPLQSFSLNVRNGKFMDHFWVKVLVNGEIFKTYESLYDIPNNAPGCLVKTGINGGLDVYFGNGYFGIIPPLGSEIIIQYLTTNGAAGNLLNETGISFKFIDDGLDMQGESVDLNEVLKVLIEKPILFGSNPEPIELTKLIAPKTSRSFVLANKDNYNIFLEKFNMFSVIDCFSTFDDNYLDDDNVIYIFLIPDVNKRLTGNDNYFSIPMQYFMLTQHEKEKIYTLIEESGQKMVTAVNKVVDPIIRRYVLNISINILEGTGVDYVYQNIIDLVSNYMLNNRRRDRIPRSELLSLIEGLDGIDSVNLWFLSEANEANLRNDPSIGTLTGLDEFGDIIIGRGEYPIIRGGWNDRNGIFYEDGIDFNKPSSINIEIKKIISDSYSLEKHRQNVENLR